MIDKWKAIEKISKMSDKYGDKLVVLMSKYKKSNLREITQKEANEFLEKLKLENLK